MGEKVLEQTFEKQRRGWDQGLWKFTKIREHISSVAIIAIESYGKNGVGWGGSGGTRMSNSRMEGE